MGTNDGKAEPFRLEESLCQSLHILRSDRVYPSEDLVKLKNRTQERFLASQPGGNAMAIFEPQRHSAFGIVLGVQTARGC